MPSRRAFTLVELLVVIAIIGTLVALLLPAVQAARETARKSQCANHIKQLALASLNHESAQGHFPTGGWGYQWVGEPDAGYGENQPGSWAYNLLAYVEQPALRQLGSGIADINVRQEKLVQLAMTPLDIFNCPSKRPLKGFPIHSRFFWLAVNAFDCTPANGCLVARGDYRANGGSVGATDATGPGPLTDPKRYPLWTIAANQNGVVHQRSMIRTAQITDGTSHTFLIGEKALTPERYFDGSDTADDQSVYSGHDNDNAGYTGDDPTEFFTPIPDYPERKVDTPYRFGGPHVDGFAIAMCEGSVSFMAFDVDKQAFRRLGGRDDDEN